MKIKLTCWTSLWNRDQWVHFWRPRNILHITVDADTLKYRDYCHVIVSVLGFVFFLEYTPARNV